MVAGELCQRCAALQLARDDFVEPPFERGRHDGQKLLESSLGTLRGNQQCALCRLILRCLIKNERGNLPSNDDVSWGLFWSVNNPEYEPTLQNESLFGSGLYANLISSETQRENRVELVDVYPAAGFLRAQISTEDTIDIDRLRRWIRTCRESHGTPHRKSYFHSPVHPTEIPGFKVINVHQECLSRLEADNDYLTLSYVWGGKNDVLTTKARLDGFSTEGAFKQVVLPKTIRDAIDLTKELGYTYLWIDSLCIVQDDAVEKPGLIASMGAIYANSILTIVAATSANAESGLSGYRNASRQSGKPVHESIAPDLQLGVLPHFAVEYMDCFHATRGWTFQEVNLSSRCLVFLNGAVYFSCANSLWREDVTDTPEARAAHGSSTVGLLEMDQPLQQYAYLVQSYMERNLTYPSDGLNAFAGVLQASIERLSKSKTYCGIPAVAFDWGMLWEGTSALKKREAFPSWSWVGVEGNLSLAIPCGVDLDQEWLRQRTWIDWYMVNAEGRMLAVWDPERDGSNVTEVNESDDGEGSLTGEDEHEHANSETSDEDDEDYEEPCPTYGTPTSTSCYGRHDVVLPSSWPPKPNANNQPQAAYAENTLHFTTIGIRLQINENFFLDPSGRKCGALRGPLLDSNSTNSEYHDILVLSWASPGTTGMGHSLTQDLDPQYRVSDEARDEGGGAGVQWEVLVGEWHAWAYMNVLVVRRSEHTHGQGDGDDGLLERVGIGLVHVSALDREGVGRRWRDVWVS